MYLSLPALILLNLTLVVALFQVVLLPSFALPRLAWADHVFLDRGRIAHLFWLDRLNCQFCGYANGLCTLLNRQLDALAGLPPRAGGWRWGVASVAALVTAPFWVLFDLYTVRFLYGVIISRCLRMPRFSWAEGAALLHEQNYAGQLAAPARITLRLWKNAALALAMLLEQIESAWCPLRHPSSGVGLVFPRHHDGFFGAGKIEELREARNFLQANGGTVAVRTRAETDAKAVVPRGK